MFFQHFLGQIFKDSFSFFSLPYPVKNPFSHLRTSLLIQYLSPKLEYLFSFQLKQTSWELMFSSFNSLEIQQWHQELIQMKLRDLYYWERAVSRDISAFDRDFLGLMSPITQDCSKQLAVSCSGVCTSVIFLPTDSTTGRIFRMETSLRNIFRLQQLEMSLCQILSKASPPEGCASSLLIRTDSVSSFISTFLKVNLSGTQTLQKQKMELKAGCAFTNLSRQLEWGSERQDMAISLLLRSPFFRHLSISSSLETSVGISGNWMPSAIFPLSS